MDGILNFRLPDLVANLSNMHILNLEERVRLCSWISSKYQPYFPITMGLDEKNQDSKWYRGGKNECTYSWSSTSFGHFLQIPYSWDKSLIIYLNGLSVVRKSEFKPYLEKYSCFIVYNLHCCIRSNLIERLIDKSNLDITAGLFLTLSLPVRLILVLGCIAH